MLVCSGRKLHINPVEEAFEGLAKVFNSSLNSHNQNFHGGTPAMADHNKQVKAIRQVQGLDLSAWDTPMHLVAIACSRVFNVSCGRTGKEDQP